MPALLNSRISAVILSRGSTWNPQPHEPPYTLPDTSEGWPAGATAQCVFYDNAGGQLATVSGTVTLAGISFTAVPAVADLIPAGANFEIFLTVGGAPHQIRYGKVLRREAQFTQAPESVTTPLAFTDSWPTLGLRSTWIPNPVLLTVHDNSGGSLPNGVSADTAPLIPQVATYAAMRWYKPLATDTVAAKVSLLNQHTYSPLASGELRVILCANTAFTSYLGADFVASSDGGGTHNNYVQFFTGSDPYTVTFRGSPVNNLVADGDDYTVRYDDATSTISVYKGTDTTPLGSWADSTHIVPHGPGYRYVGLAGINYNNTEGIQATTWQAIDDL